MFSAVLCSHPQLPPIHLSLECRNKLVSGWRRSPGKVLKCCGRTLQERQGLLLFLDFQICFPSFWGWDGRQGSLVRDQGSGYLPLQSGSQYSFSAAVQIHRRLPVTGPGKVYNCSAVCVCARLWSRLTWQVCVAVYRECVAVWNCTPRGLLFSFHPDIPHVCRSWSSLPLGFSARH